MGDIIDEVINENKYIQRVKFFKKLLPIILILVIIISLLIALFSWKENKTKTYNQTIGDSLILPLFKNDINNQLVDDTLSEINNNAKNRQKELVAIKIVSRKIEANNIEGALNDLETIILNKHYLDITTAFARIFWLTLILDIDNLSNNQETMARNYLQYFKNNSQPFYIHALLIKALFYKKIHQNDLVKTTIDSILNSSEASNFYKEQAKALLRSI